MKLAVAPSSRGMSESPARQLYVPVALFALCLTAQLYLVFNKSFNWDEFIHFSQVYQLRAGHYIQSFQLFHLRALWWAPDVSADLLDQMTAARLLAWGMHVLTLAMIYGLARQFTGAANSFFAAFAYLTAGFVFTQAFSIRSDPFVTAVLVGALLLLARDKFGWIAAIAAGALIGLAGMMTVKAVFYAPCFAGLAWLRYRGTPNKSEWLAKLATLTGAAIFFFLAFYLYQLPGAVNAVQAARDSSAVSFFLRWFTIGMPFANFVAKEIMLAPLFFASIAFAPIAWRKSGLSSEQKVALAGFIAPLFVLLFYRNTFPYFFTFLLAPIAVAIAPALALVRERYGNAFVAIVLSVAPLTLSILEPRDVIRRQQALIDYVHQEFPAGTHYLDYSGMIADYPRILTHLTSGNGMRLYHQRGEAVIAREIYRGTLPFIIANQEAISAALEDRPIPGTFLPADLEAMRGNYVRQWGVLWREGVSIPRGTEAFEFELYRPGPFVVAGGSIFLDGAALANGMRVSLKEGRHVVRGSRRFSTILWRGERLPKPPPNLPLDSVFTRF